MLMALNVTHLLSGIRGKLEMLCHMLYHPILHRTAFRGGLALGDSIFYDIILLHCEYKLWAVTPHAICATEQPLYAQNRWRHRREAS